MNRRSRRHTLKATDAYHLSRSMFLFRPVSVFLVAIAAIAQALPTPAEREPIAHDESALGDDYELRTYLEQYCGNANALTSVNSV